MGHGKIAHSRYNNVLVPMFGMPIALECFGTKLRTDSTDFGRLDELIRVEYKNLALW